MRPLASVVLPAAQAEAVLADCRRFEASEEWCGPSESASVENLVCLSDVNADSCRQHACKSSWFLLWWSCFGGHTTFQLCKSHRVHIGQQDVCMRVRDEGACVDPCGGGSCVYDA